MSVHLSDLSSAHNIFYLHSSSHENPVYSSFDLREVWSAVGIFFPACFHQISKLIQILNDIQHSGAENRNLDFPDSTYDFLKRTKQTVLLACVTHYRSRHFHGLHSHWQQLSTNKRTKILSVIEKYDFTYLWCSSSSYCCKVLSWCETLVE